MRRDDRVHRVLIMLAALLAIIGAAVSRCDQGMGSSGEPDPGVAHDDVSWLEAFLLPRMADFSTPGVARKPWVGLHCLHPAILPAQQTW